MKKLMAITVMIALCASAAFADTTVSGGVETRLMAYQVTLGNHGPAYDGGHPKPTTSGAIGTANIQLDNTNAEGTMGGTFRLRLEDIFGNTDAFRFHKVFVWWKPIPQLKVFLGQDADGLFERGQLTSWAFHQGSEAFLEQHDWDFWRERFPGNWDTFGVALSFYLVDGLELNLVIPTGNPSGWPRHRNSDITRTSDLDQIYPSALQLTGGYQIGDIGKIHFAWIGSGGKWDSKKTGTFGKAGLSFYSGGLVQGLQFQVGASMDIQNTGKDENDADITPKTATAPVKVGVGVHFSAGDFGIKWRLGTDIETKKILVDTDKYADSGAYFLTTNIMPTYKLGALGTVCLDIGISINQGAKTVKAPNETETPDADFGFWVNPYLKKSISGGYVQAGLLVTHNINGTGHGVIHVAKGEGPKPVVKVPMLMGMSF